MMAWDRSKAPRAKGACGTEQDGRPSRQGVPLAVRSYEFEGAAHAAPSPSPESTTGRSSGAMTGRESTGAGLSRWVHPPDPPWARGALLGLIVFTAILYTWRLGDSMWANAFYSAAVQAATKSWEAFFFGSFDAGNFITVDKPPLFLWVMDLSARLFGLSPWSILVPQAIEGTASVLLIYATVRRWFGAIPGLVSGLVLALTPAAALMFRFNNPDAMLTLLFVASAYATVRAIESSRTSWLVLAGALIGCAFMTKYLEAYLVIPVFTAVYLRFAEGPLARKIRQIGAAAGALLVSSGWWVLIVSLIPPWRRPYIGSSQHNSLLNLIFGYNGLGRLNGHEVGAVGGKGPVTTFHVHLPLTAALRLFESQMGSDISWLIPAAVVLALSVAIFASRGSAWDPWRIQIYLWAGWLAVGGALFSFSRGIIHPYYTVALAPAVAGTVGVGADFVRRQSGCTRMRLLAALAVSASAAWSFVKLQETPTWMPGLRLAVLVAAGIAVLLLVVGPRAWGGLSSRIMPVGLLAGLLAVLIGPAAFTFATVGHPLEGALPNSGPVILRADPHHRSGRGIPWAGGLLHVSRPSPALQNLLESNARRYTWVAAVVRANPAAGYQLATGDPVMAVGGFNGTDAAPTLAQFKADVRRGEIHFFIASPRIRFGHEGTAGMISRWVGEHFVRRTVQGIVLYDLTRAVRGGQP